MVDYTNPVTTTFELQRKTLKQGQKALEQTVELQQEMAQGTVELIDSSEVAQRHAVDFQHKTAHTALDNVEQMLPGSEASMEQVREFVDEQFQFLLENHADAFEALRGELENGVDAHGELSDDYLETVDEQLSLLLQAHEDLETQSIEMSEQVEQQVETVEEQLGEFQSQVQSVSEQALETAEV